MELLVKDNLQRHKESLALLVQDNLEALELIQTAVTEQFMTSLRADIEKKTRQVVDGYLKEGVIATHENVKGLNFFSIGSYHWGSQQLACGHSAPE